MYLKILTLTALFPGYVFLCYQKKNKNYAGKIKQIPKINYAFANAVVMKFDAQHFYIIIHAVCKYGQLADSFKTSE